MRSHSHARVSALPLVTSLMLGFPRPLHAQTPAEERAVVVDASRAPVAPAPAPLDPAPAPLAAPGPGPVVVEATEPTPASAPDPVPLPGEPARPPVADEPPLDEPGAVAAHEVDKALSSGLALGTGVGTDNVFLGGHVAYYAQFPAERVRVVAHVGGGVLYDDVGDFLGGGRGGLYFAYGARHRLVAGVYGGTLGARSYTLHGVVIGQHRENGVGFSAGWEWMHETGLYLRATVGPALAFTPDEGLVRRGHHWVWRGNFFAVGYKLW